MPSALHIVPRLGRGGAELQLTRIAAHLQRSDPQTVLTLRPVDRQTGLAAAGCNVITGNLSLDPISTTKGVLAVLRELHGKDFDLVFGWLYHGMTVAPLISRWLRAAPPMIWMVRSSMAAYPSMSMVSRANVRLARSLSRYASRIVYNSQRAAREHTEFGFSPERSAVIHNGIDPTEFRYDDNGRHRIRAKLGIREHELLVGLVARFHPVKDHVTFVRAAKILSGRHPETRFALIGRGTGPENRGLQELLREAAVLDRFVLCGEQDDISKFLSGLDIAVSCSISEGFSNTIAEAMMSEVPCVATDVGDSAIIVGEWGRVVPPASPVDLAHGVSELIAANSEERRRLGAGARQHAVANFSFAAAQGRLERLLSEAISERGARQGQAYPIK